METVEFLTMAYALACTIGPAMGVLLLIVVLVLDWLNRRGFSITVGIAARDQYEWE